jgi:hypothetical protein
MASHIGRRKFLATLGGASAPSPLVWAQQPAMPLIGFLNSQSAFSHMVAGFWRGLSSMSHGW